MTCIHFCKITVTRLAACETHVHGWRAPIATTAQKLSTLASGRSQRKGLLLTRTKMDLACCYSSPTLGTLFFGRSQRMGISSLGARNACARPLTRNHRSRGSRPERHPVAHNILLLWRLAVLCVRRQAQARVADEMTHARRKSLPYVFGAGRGVHGTRPICKYAGPEHKRDTARTRMKIQQTLLVVELAVDDLVAPTRHATQVHMPREAPQLDVTGDWCCNLFFCGGVDCFLEKPHSALPTPCQAKMHTGSGPIIVQLFRNC